MSDRAMRFAFLGAVAALLGAVGFRIVSWFQAHNQPTVQVVDAAEQVNALVETREVRPDTEYSLTPEETRIFFPSAGKTNLLDPLVYALHRPNETQWRHFGEHPDGGFEVRTNGLGFRSDLDPAATPPDLRVLVVGDSHLELAANDELLPGVLERQLRGRHPGRTVEVWNAGHGGWGVYNYLGAIRKWSYLKPDLFIVVLYGGNDFAASMGMYHFFRGEKIPLMKNARLKRARDKMGGRKIALTAQHFGGVFFFHGRPEEERAASNMAAELTLEIERECRNAGIQLLVVYLPSAAQVQPALFPDIREALESFDGNPHGAQVTDRLADAWVEDLSHRGIAHLDLRPIFRTADTPLYWHSDHHLNVDGHALMAEAILPIVERAAAASLE